jgi:hypothetical protein
VVGRLFGQEAARGNSDVRYALACRCLHQMASFKLKDIDKLKHIGQLSKILEVSLLSLSVDSSPFEVSELEESYEYQQVSGL